MSRRIREHPRSFGLRLVIELRTAGRQHRPFGFIEVRRPGSAGEATLMMGVRPLRRTGAREIAGKEGWTPTVRSLPPSTSGDPMPHPARVATTRAYVQLIASRPSSARFSSAISACPRSLVSAYASGGDSCSSAFRGPFARSSESHPS